MADRQALHFDPLNQTLDFFGFGSDSSLAAVQSGALGFERHGDTPRWLQAVDGLPGLRAAQYALDQPIIHVGSGTELDDTEHRAVISALGELRPWRKGPFRIFGIHVDAEWRSDLKWSRVARGIGSLHGHRVLDIGCGNGYYCLRALGAGATSVLGIEPSPLFVLQFELLRRSLPPLPTAVLPLAFEALPPHPSGFDTVLSMGLLYHRKAPREHLRRLGSFMSEHGQLVLETLVVEPRFGPVFEPRGRYANMGNVWSIPSIPELSSWLHQAGFGHIRVLDITTTTPLEQRATPWSNAHSLRDALDPEDPTKTIEGHPAPLRAVVVARR